VNFERGFPLEKARVTASGPATYSGLTFGLDFILKI
jgi:hypothetical protein